MSECIILPGPFINPYTNGIISSVVIRPKSVSKPSSVLTSNSTQNLTSLDVLSNKDTNARSTRQKKSIQTNEKIHNKTKEQQDKKRKRRRHLPKTENDIMFSLIEHQNVSQTNNETKIHRSHLKNTSMKHNNLPKYKLLQRPKELSQKTSDTLSIDDNHPCILPRFETHTATSGSPLYLQSNILEISKSEQLHEWSVCRLQNPPFVMREFIPTNLTTSSVGDKPFCVSDDDYFKYLEYYFSNPDQALLDYNTSYTSYDMWNTPMVIHLPS